MAGMGVALGSGGARGWCHIGVLRALDEMGAPPRAIAGCSMGALVGAVYAAGRLDALEEWARGLTRRSFVTLLDVGFGQGGLVAGDEILAVLQRLDLPERVEDLPMPFAAVATDMRTGEEIWLREGPLAEVVRASVALPGVISPFRLDGQWLLDGGLVNPVPVSTCRALGADSVIAVNPNGRPDRLFWRAETEQEAAPRWTAMKPYLPEALRGLLERREAAPSYLDVVTGGLNIMIDRVRRSRMEVEPPDLLLEAALPDMLSLEFYRADEAIAEGRRICQEAARSIGDLAAD